LTYTNKEKLALSEDTLLALDSVESQHFGATSRKADRERQSPTEASRHWQPTVEEPILPFKPNTPERKPRENGEAENRHALVRLCGTESLHEPSLAEQALGLECLLAHSELKKRRGERETEKHVGLLANQRRGILCGRTSSR
jgi:hypothetical protein